MGAYSRLNQSKTGWEVSPLVTIRIHLCKALCQSLLASPKTDQTQRKELSDPIAAGLEAVGYASGCWSASVIQDLIQRRFGVENHPQYICALLDTLGFSFQKARFVSDHLDEAARQA
jgi:transposase